MTSSAQTKTKQGQVLIMFFFYCHFCAKFEEQDVTAAVAYSTDLSSTSLFKHILKATHSHQAHESQLLESH